MNKMLRPNDTTEVAADLLRTIGRNIRHLRSGKGLTLQVLGEQTGLSPSMLSLLERGKTGPSIGTLVVLASALGAQMTDLLDSSVRDSHDVVARAASQRTFQTAEGVLRRIAKHDLKRGVEIAINKYEPDTASAPKPLAHEGYEYGLTLEGRLRVTVSGQTYDMEQGDSISYPSTEPHQIVNPGPGRTRALWVNLKKA
jgi:transcriptional regulator with XRE-family HTH domain